MEDTTRVLFYDKDGNGVMDKMPFLTDLWQLLGKEQEKPQESLDYSKLLVPISSAHQDVKAILMILDQILAHTPQQLSSHKLTHSMPHDNQTPSTAHKKEVYLEAARVLRQRADTLEKDLMRDRELCQFAHYLKGLGWPVQFSKRQGAWLVDYGYKSRFAHFWEHLKTIEERASFALITAPLALCFPSTMSYSRLLINNKAAPKLWENAKNNKEVEYIKQLKKVQQSLMERDYFELLKERMINHYEKVQVATNRVEADSMIIEMISEEGMQVEENPAILKGIHKYLCKNEISLNELQ